MVTVLTADAKETGVDKKMALRFMGCKDGFNNEELEKIYDKCLDAYYNCARPKAVMRKTAVNFEDDNTVRFDFGVIKSESLSRNLKGCKSAYVFAATVGSEVDRYIKRFSLLSQAEGMIFSCIASSGIECWCDLVNEQLKKENSLCPRFSPGYGDVGLEHQSAVLDFLDAHRKIGLTLTGSLMMVPVKSVTAIVGIKEK